MKILHLSDLHVTPPNKSLRQVWSPAAAALSRGGHSSFDFVVVSGDLSQQAEKAEYDALLKFASDFLLPLVSDKRSRVVFVPGNHDVDWSKQFAMPVGMSNIKSRADLEALEKTFKAVNKSPQDCGHRVALSQFGHLELLKINQASYSSRLNTVQDFLNTFYGDALKKDPDDLLRHFDLVADPINGADWSAHVFPESNVAFFGLNSCHLNDTYWQGAHFNPEAVANVTAHVARLKRTYKDMQFVAVWHHGFVSDRGRPDRLTLEDIGELLNAGFIAGMHGHTHKADQQIVDLLRTRIAIISTGSLGAGAPERPGAVGNQFTIATLKPGRIRAEVFSLDDQNKQYSSGQSTSFSIAPREKTRSANIAVGHHERTWTIREDGIAQVSVKLSDVRTDDRVVLAVLSPPFCNTLFDKQAAVDRGYLSAEETTLSDGRVRYTVLAPATSYEELSWQYSVSNCVALTQPDLSILSNRRTLFPNLPPRHETRGHTVRMETERLVLRLVLPEQYSDVGKLGVLVETHIISEDENRWERIPAEERRCEREKKGNCLELRVAHPLTGCRYSIIYIPPAIGQSIQRPARQLAGRLIEQCRLRVPHDSDRSLSTALKVAVKEVFAEVFPDIPAGAASDLLLGEEDGWIAHVWDQRDRTLYPIFGQFSPRAWAKTFRAGNGVAGHAFRFARAASWHIGDDGVGSCIYEHAVRANCEWILAIPIHVTLNGPAIAVVSFSGTASPHPLNRRLYALVQHVSAKATVSWRYLPRIKRHWISWCFSWISVLETSPKGQVVTAWGSQLRERNRFCLRGVNFDLVSIDAGQGTAPAGDSPALDETDPIESQSTAGVPSAVVPPENGSPRPVQR